MARAGSSAYAGAAHARGLFQFGVRIAQRGADEQERERRPQKAFDDHHAGHGIDVDEDIRVAGERAVEMIDRSGLAEEQKPSGDVENVRCAERDDRGEIGECLERVGALDDPGGDPADHERSAALAAANTSELARGEEIARVQHGCEIAETPLVGERGRPRNRHTSLQQKHERRHHQRAKDHNQHGCEQSGLAGRDARPSRRCPAVSIAGKVAHLREIGRGRHRRVPYPGRFWPALCSPESRSASGYLPLVARCERHASTLFRAAAKEAMIRR